MQYWLRHRGASTASAAAWTQSSWLICWQSAFAPHCTATITGEGPITGGDPYIYGVTVQRGGGAGCGNPIFVTDGWQFTESCASDGKAWNPEYGGCAQICTPPETLNTTTGLCEGPPPADTTQRSCPNGALSKANPCDVLSGNKHQREVDYAPGTGALAFVRTYASLGYHTATQGAFGKPLGESWSGSYLQFVSAASGLSSSVVHAVRPNGDVIEFAATMPGSTSTQYEAEGELKDRLLVATNLSGAFVGWRYITANDDEELYDTNGRLLTITSRADAAQTLTYGGNSRVASVVDDFGHELTFQWDTASPPRLASVTLPGSGSGQIVFTYGANNNLTQVTYPDTRTREYLYELTGTGQENLLTGIEDESGVRYATWGYGSGNVVTSSSHAGGVDSYAITYNPDGTRVVVDPLGTSRTYTTAMIAGQRRYTGSNLLCPGCNEYASATFDAFGNFESKVDFGGIETRFTHDTARTLETSRTEAYGTPRARTISTTWHPSYRLPNVITEPGRTTDFDFDSNGNLLELEITDTATSDVRRTTWTYDPYGRLLTQDGPRTDATDVTTLAYYTCGTGYQCGQVQSVTNALSQVTTFDTYNAHGQPLQITDPNGVVATLAYDYRQRLTSRTVVGEQTQLEYWPTGLVKKVTLPDASFLLYTYDNAHRLTRIDDAAGHYVVYTLDGMGNGRMKTLKKGSTTATFTYNALGELVKRVGGTPGTVNYVYDEAGHLLGEYNSTGALVQETIWLGDTPVAMLRPGTPVGIFYVHTDHLNTPRKVTRPSDNKARWTWESDPFGTALPNENPQSLGNFKYNLRFPGQMYDAHTGLNYNYFRDYDAVIGRYVESDPIGLLGGVNTYAYVTNSPISKFDPFGLEGIGYWTFPPGPERDAFERRLRNCSGDEDCVARCLQEYYGNFYDTALGLSPFSIASVVMDEATEVLEDAAKREATRNLNSPNYYTGKRQMALLKVFRGFNAVGAVVGVGAGAFVVGANGYCTVRCAFE